MSVYKVAVMLWILVGLGYWVLVLNFLQKTLKSKEVLKTLKSTSRLIAKEADELRAALAEVGLIHRDATFIPEHSKMALSMMLSMSRSLAGTTPSGGEEGEGASAPPADLRGIHSIGSNLRSQHGLLAALMAALPTPAQTTSTGLKPAAGPATGAAEGEDLAGRVNAGYLSDDTAEQVPSPTPGASTQSKAEVETEVEIEAGTDRESGPVRKLDQNSGAQEGEVEIGAAVGTSPGCGV